MQCTVIVYVDDLLVTCKDEATIAEVIEAVKVKNHDGQEHMRVKCSYLGVHPSRSLEAAAGTAEESYQVLHVP